MSEQRVQRSVRIAAIMIIIAGVFTLLIVAKKVLIPIVIAAILAYATIALSGEIKRNIWLGKTHVPTWLAHLISFAMLGAMAYIVWMIIGLHISALIARIPFYESQLLDLLGNMNSNISTHISEALTKVDIGGLVGSLVGSVANIGSKIILVLIYVIFMIFEFPFIKNKINYIFLGHESQKQQTQNVLSYVVRDVNAYFRIKTLASIMTAVLCYVILIAFNIDFPLFWALIVFLLNFIPTIGSIIAVLFPSVLALLQFGSLGKFAAVLILLIAVQLFVGNFVEPRIAGRVLNISPLVIILALVCAGALWGIVGMIISVPVVIFIKIVAEQFPMTKLVSVLLSRDGTHEQ
jgi:predicted PurR-regulated permease PerM